MDTAVAAGSFKTLAASLQCGGSAPNPKLRGPFTVLTDLREAAEGAAVEDLLKPENKAKLAEDSSPTTVAGKAPAADVVKG